MTVSKLMGILGQYPKDTGVYFQADGWGSDGASFGIHADGDLMIRIDGGVLTPEGLKLVVHGLIEDKTQSDKSVAFHKRRRKIIACEKKWINEHEGKEWDSGLVNCPDCLALRD